MALKNLSSLSETEYKEFLDSFDTVLTDCDGVLWIENDVIQNAPNVMNKFKEIGKKVFFITNNSTKTRDEFIVKFKQLGFNVTVEEVVSTAHLVAVYLKSKNFNKKVYIVGSSGISKELDNVGISSIGVGPDPMTNLTSLVKDTKLDPDVGAVVVGFDEYISLPKLLKAAGYLEKKESLFIATNTDERFPMGNQVIMPGTGTMVAAVQTCAERKPFIIGKPEAFIRKYLIDKYNTNPSRTIMIGDRCNSDILFGKRCGFKTLLVLTGVTNLEEVTQWKASSDQHMRDLVPDYYTDKIGDLLPHLSS